MKMDHGALIRVILLLLLALVILRTAWVCDDAYISFRTVYNITHGYGPVWNTTERVQAFTNPLWVILMAFLTRFTGEMYFTAIITSLLLTVTAASVVVFRIVRDTQMAILAISILLLSKAFIDYATSGLENPLSYFLMACFAWGFYHGGNRVWRFGLLCAIAAIAAVNRPDSILLYAPALVVAFWQVRSWRTFALGVAAFAPLWFWEGFSILYYGFPFPNTYYAKLHAGISQSERLWQGIAYYVDTLSIDPLTLLMIATAIALVIVQRRVRELPLVIGLVLYLLYTIRVGGDFMTGRYFTVPLVLAAIIIARTRLPQSGMVRVVPLAVVLLVGLSAPRCPIFTAETFGSQREDGINQRGIADERAWYYQHTGLLRMDRSGAPVENHPWYLDGLEARDSDEQVVAMNCIGFFGYAIGPEKHVVDGYGLSNPLLARLPIDNTRWRIGHFLRHHPAGYWQSLVDDENKVVDSGLSLYYDKLKSIVRGSLFTRERLTNILKMNLGYYDHLLDNWTNPKPMVCDYELVSTPIDVPALWDDQGHFILNRAGITITMDAVCRDKYLELSVDHNDIYTLVLLLDSKSVGTVGVSGGRPSEGGMRVDTVDVPQAAYENGYDCIEVRPERGDRLYSLGHLRLLSKPE